MTIYEKITGMGSVDRAMLLRSSVAFAASLGGLSLDELSRRGEFCPARLGPRIFGPEDTRVCCAAHRVRHICNSCTEGFLRGEWPGEGEDADSGT